MIEVITSTLLIQDIDLEVTVDITGRKEIFSYLDEYLYNFPEPWFDATWATTHILYKDGSYDSIGSDYDEHKIKRQ